MGKQKTQNTKTLRFLLSLEPSTNPEPVEWLRIVDNVRTGFELRNEYIYIPDLKDFMTD